MDNFIVDFLTDTNNIYLDFETNICREISPNDYTFYHIKEVTFESKSPPKEALENVLGALRIDGINFIYLILGDKKGVNFYFGISKDSSFTEELPFNIYDIGENVLKPSLKGNFRGSNIISVDKTSKIVILEKIKKMKQTSYIEGVPGVNEDDDKFQGVDRLVDVMLGDEFALMVIAKPIKQSNCYEIEQKLNKAYSNIVPFMKESVQTNSSKNTSKNTSNTTGDNTSTSENYSKATTKGENTSTAISNGTSKTNGTSGGKSSTKGTSKSSGSSSNSSGTTDSVATNTGDSKSDGTSYNKTETTGTNKSETKTVGKTETKGTSNSSTAGESSGESFGNSSTKEFIKKEVQDWIKYLDETIYERLDYGKGKGIFVTSTYLCTSEIGTLLKLENTVKSLYSGEKGNKVALKSTPLKNGNTKMNFQNLQIPHCSVKMSDDEICARSILSQYALKNNVLLGNWISAKELSLIAGLPKKEVVGLKLREEVEFGLNIDISSDDSIELGNIIQSGQELEITASLEKDVLNKHVFVTGVTGSGKTTTCQKILIESELPFLVIEPAKTEYRILNEVYDDLLIFTLGNDNVAPFRLNPFEFLPHENITSRVDMIKASFEANFDMEAAIPQLIETAIYECYKDYGWNIKNNKNSLFDDPFADGINAFPVISDLILKVTEVVDKQGFDDRLKNDYIGSIKARLQGLTVGSKGLMLNTKRSVDFIDLLDKKVVLEIEEVRSSAEKSLIIGFVLTNLIEAVKAKFKENPSFKHITLIEEAHRLLSKFTQGDSLNKKQSVETFTDMLAEVRKYGESLIISDQIPAKLATEVLKNTNTKIVHKIFAGDDKESIGNTMSLTEDQQDFLSNLEVGRAIYFTQGFTKSVQVQISRKTNTTGNKIIEDTVLRQKVLEYYCKMYKKGIIDGTHLMEKQPTIDELEEFIQISSNDEILDSYDAFLNNKDDFKAILSKYNHKIIKIIIQSTYRKKNAFENLINDIVLGKEISSSDRIKLKNRRIL